MAAPAQQGPALPGQLSAEQDMLSGSQICRQQLFIAFYWCHADGEPMRRLLSQPPRAAAAVCSDAGEGSPCPAWAGESVPAFSRGMLKELHFKGSGRVHVAFGSTSPRFGVEAACVSSWSQEATRG